MLTIRQSWGLHGTVHVSGSKNAALPLIGANYVVGNAVTLKNLPDILDVQRLLEVWILAQQQSKDYYDLTDPLVSKMRASILLIPYGLLNYGTVHCIGSGGCKLGKRSLDTFDSAFDQAWVTMTDKGDVKVYAVTGAPASEIVLDEFSVTTAEALITYLAFHPKLEKTTIRQIAIEPHVMTVIEFLQQCGADITIHFDHAVTLRKAEKTITKDTFTVIGDYLEVGLFSCIGALAEKSDITITGCPLNHLVAPLHVLTQIGVDVRPVDEQTVRVTSKNKHNYQALKKLKSRIYPGFPTDIQPQFTVLLTQCHGVSKIFETLFEGRFAYLAELQNLGATIEILNPHQALILGPTPLKWWYVSSTDIRGWGAMMVAGIIAEWETIITNEEMISRGYENIVEKLKSIGVSIAIA